MRRRLIVGFAAVLLSLAVGVSVALATQTYYFATSSTYQSLDVNPHSTASVALRIDNNVHCQFATCHTDVWYTRSAAGGGGDFGTRHSNGAQDNNIGKSIDPNTVVWINAYSKCSTTSGFGTNSARCWTDW